MRYANTKMGKYTYLRRFSSIAGYLPPSRKATQANVNAMLQHSPSVYLKPNNGTAGMGIWKLMKAGSQYRLKSGFTVRSFPTFKSCYTFFAKAVGKRPYLVQRGIPLLTYRQRPFDLRIMVQKGPTSRWEVTGMVGRVAQRGKIVTNYHNGGRPMPVDTLLKPHFRQRTGSFKNTLSNLCRKVGAQMHPGFPGCRAFGIDVAVDQRLRPWILEVNTRPDKYIFRALPDKTMFRRVMRYARFK